MRRRIPRYLYWLGGSVVSSLGAFLALSLLINPGDYCLSAPVPKAEAPNHPSYTETIPGSSVRFDMVAIPGGVFWMGSPQGEKDRRPDEGPRHRVQVRPFWMGKTEVTWEEYLLLLSPPPLRKDHHGDGIPGEEKIDAVTCPSPSYLDLFRGFGSQAHPAIGISHHAAREYCRWLSATTGRSYRLPTEAEWEYACRAGTTSAFTWGDDPADLDHHAWFDENARETTHPVGRKKPNPWGLYDMYGNVAEWCLDHYQADYYRTSSLEELSRAPVKLPTAARYPHVVRGGSWADPTGWCRSAARRGSNKTWNQSDPDRPQSIWWLADADFVGFRVVRAVEEQTNLQGLRSEVTKASK